MAGGWILGFDIGGTKTAVVVGTTDGTVLDREVFASHPERGFDALWQDIVAAGERLMAKHGRPGTVGVSIGGPLDSERGIIYSPPNLPHWDAVPLRELLVDAFGVPTYVEHDAKACTLAEWMFGAARGRRDLVFLTVGTGLGAGFIVDGRLARGATDTAGNVGHWRIAETGPFVWGKHGSWEGYTSGAGIQALAAHLFPGAYPPSVTAAEIIASARAGEAKAREIVAVSATYLGRGIALLADLLNPEMVVLGSLVVRAGDLFLPIARRVLLDEATPLNARTCEIVPAALGEQLGDVAALCAALYRRDASHRDVP